MDAGTPRARPASVIQPEGEAKGKIKHVDERGKTWTGANAIPVGGWENARKEEENRNAGASEQVERARKKGFEA